MMGISNAHHKINKPLMVFLCLVPLQWIKLVSLGGGTLKLAHLGLLIPPLVLLMRQRVEIPLKSATFLYLAHPILFAVLLLSLPLSQQPGVGMFIVVRMLAYYMFGLIIFAWLSALEPEEFAYTLSKAIFYVLPTLLVAFSYYVFVSGTNVIDVFINAIKSGNPNYIQFHLFVIVLNKGSLEGLSREETIDAAGRHGIMIFLIIVLFARALMPRFDEAKREKRWGWILGFLLVLIVFISLSRAALLILICAMLMLIVNRMIRKTVPPWVYIFIVSLFVLSISYLQATGGGAVGGILYQKLIVDVANNPRAHEFLQIIDLLNAKAVLGYGVGTELELFGLAAKNPHNLVLFWWHQAGILGLMVSVLTLAIFIGFSLRLWALSVSANSKVRSNFLLFAAILLIPAIIRMLVAKQGALALTEWISVALAVSACVAYGRYFKERKRPWNPEVSLKQSAK